MSDFRALFPDDFHYEDNRAIHFVMAEVLSAEKLERFIASVLTYHRK